MHTTPLQFDDDCSSRPRVNQSVEIVLNVVPVVDVPDRNLYLVTAFVTDNPDLAFDVGA